MPDVEITKRPHGAKRVVIIAPMPANSVTSPPSGVAHYTDQMIRNKFENVVLKVFAQSDATEWESSSKCVEAVWRPGFRAPLDLARRLLRRDFDVIHFQHEFRILGSAVATFMIVPLLLIAKMSRIRIVITMHGVVPSGEIDLLTSGRFRLLFKLVAHMFLYIIYRCHGVISDVLLVHHTYFKARIVEDWGVRERKVKVVPFGYVNYGYELTERIADPNNESFLHHGAIKVLTFGFLTSYKRPELVMALAESDPKRDFRFYFCISQNPRIRSTAYEERLDNLRDRALSMPQSVVWFDYLSDEELYKLVSGCDVVVLPYTSCIAASGVASWAMELGKPFCYSEPLVHLFGDSKMMFSNEVEDLRSAIIASTDYGKPLTGELFEPWQSVADDLGLIWQPSPGE